MEGNKIFENMSNNRDKIRESVSSRASVGSERYEAFEIRGRGVGEEALLLYPRG